MPPTDQLLLKEFVANRSEKAFHQLVSRHAPVVHASLLRKLHNHALADDATQAVFVVLAQKAPALVDRPGLSAWLHKTASYAALDVLRKENTRTKHHRQAALGRPERSDEAPPEDTADRLTALDDALAALTSTDREVVMMRYLHEQPFAEIAIALGVSEEVARQRASRALAKLRMLMGRRGVALSAGALLALLGLAKPASGAILPAAAILLNPLAATSRGAAISKGVLHMLTAAKLKLLAAVSATSVAVAATGVVVYTTTSGRNTSVAPAVTTPVVAEAPTGVYVPDAEPLSAQPQVDAWVMSASGKPIQAINGTLQLSATPTVEELSKGPNTFTFTRAEGVQLSANGQPQTDHLVILFDANQTPGADPGADLSRTPDNKSIQVQGHGIVVLNQSANQPAPERAIRSEGTLEITGNTVIHRTVTSVVDKVVDAEGREVPALKLQDQNVLHFTINNAQP